MKFIVVFLLGFIFNQVYSGILMADNTVAEKLELKSYGNLDPSNPNYRLYFFIPGKHLISPIHDINLYASLDYTQQIFNMVVEIPFGSMNKKEMATSEPFNPIFQDSMRDKKGQIVEPVKPRTATGAYTFNYGALPQTWENSLIKNKGMVGDNDPLDVVELGGDKGLTVGSVLQVKILGVVGLVDSKDSDWKLIAIDINDKLAREVHDMQGVANHAVLGRRLDAVLAWFDSYRNVSYISSEDGKNLIEETHKHWIYLSIGQYTSQNFIDAGKNAVALAHTLYLAVRYNRVRPEEVEKFIKSGEKVVVVAKKTWRGRLASFFSWNRH